MTVSGDEAFKEVIRVKGGHVGGPSSQITSVFIRGGNMNAPGMHTQRGTPV